MTRVLIGCTVVALAAVGLFLFLDHAPNPGVAEPKPPGEAHAREDGATNAVGAVEDVPDATRVAIERPAESDAPTAVTVAAPSMTLGGHLAARLQSNATKGEWSGDPARVAPSPSAASVAASAQFNPERKELSVAQERQLQEIVNRFDERSRPLHAQERRTTNEALLRAVADGRFESIELARPPSASDPVAASRYARDAQSATNGLLQRMAQRFGVIGTEWTWSAMSSFEPDGVSRQNIVYLLRPNEAQVFKLRDQETTLLEERQRAYRDFFQRL